ncbi:MAG: DUF692 domain-containing protein [Polyangiales bacterium]|nr:DUF692 domain-containing protein [Myxococcales bacterium]
MNTPRVAGVGLGLRMEFAEELLGLGPKAVPWVEVHPENYMRRGGRYPAILTRALDTWPVVTHGLSMGFGNVDRFERAYLDRLHSFLRDVGTPWHSDHMCFGGADGAFVHDLLPVPFTESALALMSERFVEARDTLDIELAFENLSYYANAPESDMDEATYCAALLERADAKMLLDVNNVYVNSRNHGFDPREWIDRIPAERVVQIHVAGHLVRPDGFRIDTHAEPMCDDVYGLLEYTLGRMGPKPVLLERDGNWPKLEELLSEVERLQRIYDRATRKEAPHAASGA